MPAQSQNGATQVQQLCKELFNGELKAKYIQQKYQNYSPVSRLQIIGYFKKISQVELEKNKDVVFFNQQEMSALFEQVKWVSFGVIENRKTLIREWMREYRKQGYRNWQAVDIRGSIDLIGKQTISGQDIRTAEWFYSRQELQECLNSFYTLCAQPGGGEYDICVTLLYLAWAGVDYKEAVLIKKRDVDADKKQIHLPLGRRFVQLDAAMMKAILTYANSDGYYVTRGAKEVFLPYRASPYLLRSNRKEQITANNLLNYLSRFTEAYARAGGQKCFKYNKVRLSGVFSGLWEYEGQHGALTTKDFMLFESRLGERLSKEGKPTQRFYHLFLEYQEYKRICTEG